MAVFLHLLKAELVTPSCFNWLWLIVKTKLSEVKLEQIAELLLQLD